MNLESIIDPCSRIWPRESGNICRNDAQRQKSNIAMAIRKSSKILTFESSQQAFVQVYWIDLWAEFVLG